MALKEKKRAIKDLSALIEKHPVIGLLDMAKMPAAQLQKIRAALRGKALIKMTKKSVIKFAGEEVKKAKPSFDKLLNLIDAEVVEPALLLSEKDPFELYGVIVQNRADAFARAGDVAPQDIVIPAGKTSLPPGPLVSDLQKAGIKAAIKGPNIEIMEEKILVKAGEKISKEQADILQKLDIKPMQIELNMAAAYADKIIFSKDALQLVEKDWPTEITSAQQACFNLAFNADYPTAVTIPLKLTEAARNVINLAINAEVYTKESVEVFLTKAAAQAQSLKSAAA